MSEENNRWRLFLIGLVVGGVVGSVLTYMFADRVRRQLRERGIDVGGKLGEIVDMIKERGDEFLGRAREAIKQAIEEGKETGRKTRSDLEERFKKESGE